MANGQRAKALLPILLQAKFVNNELGSIDRLQDFHPEMSTDVACRRQASLTMDRGRFSLSSPRS